MNLHAINAATAIYTSYYVINKLLALFKYSNTLLISSLPWKRRPLADFDMKTSLPS